MVNLTDSYRLLFGRSGTTKGSDIDMSEQGRAGGVSTGQPFKFTSDVKYTLQIERDGQGNPVYIGFTNPGVAVDATGWRICKLTFDGQNDVTAMQYADGSTEFNFVWDSRGDYTYS